MRLKQAIKKALYAFKPTFVKVTVAQIQSGVTLKGKKIVITGGSRGLGRAMAEKFIAEGATVLITGKKPENLEKAKVEINSPLLYIKAFDAENIVDIPVFFEYCYGLFGTIDILVSNAGISLHEGSILNVTPDGFDKTITTNLKSHYFMAKEFLERKVKKDEEGCLLFIISKDGYVCNEIPYGLTKASVNSLVGALSTKYYHCGIRVNAIAPGVTLTDMTRYAKRSNGNMAAENYAGRNFLPEEVAEVACFLISDASKCVSGQIIFTDGGDHIKSNAEIL